MTTPRRPTSLTLLAEYIQISLELLGVMLVAAGLGVLAAWEFGMAGFLTISGATVCGVAYLYERRLRPPPPKTKPEPPSPPATTQDRVSAPVAPAPIITRTWWRFAWLVRDPGEPLVIERTWGRLAWLRPRDDDQRRDA
jgi:hypothetical protein